MAKEEGAPCLREGFLKKRQVETQLASLAVWSLRQVLEVLLGVRLEARHGPLLGEVNGPALVLDGQALRVHTQVGAGPSQRFATGPSGAR